MGWGTMMFMWMTALKLFVSGKDSLPRHQIIIDLITWPIAGFVFGLLTWHAYERAYKSTLSQK